MQVGVDMNEAAHAHVVIQLFSFLQGILKCGVVLGHVTEENAAGITAGYFYGLQMRLSVLGRDVANPVSMKVTFH